MMIGAFLGDSGFGAAATSKAPAMRLQSALANLGRVAKDTTLSAIKSDGAIGAKTVTGVNRAFTKHIGSGQAPANLRSGKLTLAQVKSMADSLSAILETEIQRRGGVATTNKTVAAKSATAKTTTTASKAIAPTSTTTKAQAVRVQKALISLGNKVGDSLLKKIKADGAIGPATAAAINKAFTKHLGSGQAPANFRTGSLTPNDVKANATTLASLLEAEVMRRGGPVAVKKTIKKVGTATKVKTATGKTATVQKVVTEEGEEGTAVTDDETGETRVSVAPPPRPDIVARNAAQAAQAAQDENSSGGGGSSAAAAPGAMVTMPGNELMPMSPQDNPGFFSTYKTPLLIGGGVVALGTIAIVMMKMRKKK